MATKPIPVRISEAWLPRLDAAAHRMGTNRARLIAFCAETFAESFEKNGMAMMPPNWRQIFAEMDGRTSASHLNSARTDVANEKNVYRKHQKRAANSIGPSDAATLAHRASPGKVKPSKS